MSDPTFEKAEAAQVNEASKNIDLLAEALEKIEALGCAAFHGEPPDQPGADARGWFCARYPDAALCAACIAHEALETFRGR